MPSKQDYEQSLKFYEDALATIPNIERKGATMPYTSVNGNMFSFLDKEGVLNLRLGDKQREDFIRKFKSSPSFQHGVVMKEYVVVPGKLLASTKNLRSWIELSFAYAKTLKKKPSKK